MRILFLIFLFFPAVTACSQTVPVATPTPGSMNLGGKIGFGIDQLDDVGPGVSARYWLSDRTALDAFGGQDYNDYKVYSFGVGLKTNLSNPAKDLFIQGVVRASYSRQIYSPFFIPGDEYDLYLGVGFEAFLPFCEWLSVEDSVLFDFSWRPSSGGQVFGVFAPTGEAMSPFNLSIHAYF
jgi:hypothetical protein